MRKYLSTLPTVVILIAALGHGLAEKVHSQLLSTGESVWSGYHLLRADPSPPECQVIAEPPSRKTDELDELLDGDTATPAQGGDELDELLDGDTATPAQGGDELDELLGDAPAAPGVRRDAVAAANRQCEERRAQYQQTLASLTPSVRAYRFVETSVAIWTQFSTNHLSHFLVLLLLISAATATWTGGHIALRSPETQAEWRIRAGAELFANVLLLNSSIALWQVEASSGVPSQNPGLLIFMMVGFFVMSLLALWKLIRPPAHLSAGGSAARGLLTVPLYASMALIAGLYFLIAEGHGAGLAIQLGRLTEHAPLYIDVGLYVWTGMLLKQTRASDLVLNMGRPWRMSPEPFALAIVAFAALPTAYSGASGILVIAAGSLIYQKLREAGSRRGLALATTAMSGSTGVVLSPCLLVVIVASLNKEVTTQELYSAGRWIFGLTLVVMAVILWLTRRQPWQVAPLREALPESVRQARPLLPYVAVFAGAALFFRLGLDARLDEHSAPVLLPVIMLLVLAYDRRSARRAPSASDSPVGFATATTHATRETVAHIGALLTLMALSVGVGGIVERADLMSAVPDQFGSVWLAMAVLVAVLVLIGMTMDPYGAVILVSATLPRVAAQNGIEAVHFWMVVLVAFELGYLTPPVALNHLLTRQVIGAEEAAAGDDEVSGSFWSRYERRLLPMTVIGLVLLIVAFAPLVAHAARR